MSIIIRLQNLPWSANAGDIRQYFRNLVIPDGGVHIIGGENGDAFIAFGSDEDARQAMLLDGGKIKEVKIKLLLSSKTEMQKVIETARLQALNMQNIMQIPSSNTPQFIPNASPAPASAPVLNLPLIMSLMQAPGAAAMFQQQPALRLQQPQPVAATQPLQSPNLQQLSQFNTIQAQLQQQFLQLINSNALSAIQTGGAAAQFPTTATVAQSAETEQQQQSMTTATTGSAEQQFMKVVKSSKDSQQDSESSGRVSKTIPAPETTSTKPERNSEKSESVSKSPTRSHSPRGGDNRRTSNRGDKHRDRSRDRGGKRRKDRSYSRDSTEDKDSHSRDRSHKRSRSRDRKNRDGGKDSKKDGGGGEKRKEDRYGSKDQDNRHSLKDQDSRYGGGKDQNRSYGARNKENAASAATGDPRFKPIPELREVDDVTIQQPSESSSDEAGNKMSSSFKMSFHPRPINPTMSHVKTAHDNKIQNSLTDQESNKLSTDPRHKNSSAAQNNNNSNNIISSYTTARYGEGGASGGVGQNLGQLPTLLDTYFSSSSNISSLSSPAGVGFSGSSYPSFDLGGKYPINFPMHPTTNDFGLNRMPMLAKDQIRQPLMQGLTTGGRPYGQAQFLLQEFNQRMLNRYSNPNNSDSYPGSGSGVGFGAGKILEVSKNVEASGGSQGGQIFDKFTNYPSLKKLVSRAASDNEIFNKKPRFDNDYPRNNNNYTPFSGSKISNDFSSKSYQNNDERDNSSAKESTGNRPEFISRNLRNEKGFEPGRDVGSYYSNTDPRPSRGVVGNKFQSETNSGGRSENNNRLNYSNENNRFLQHPPQQSFRRYPDETCVELRNVKLSTSGNDLRKFFDAFEIVTVKFPMDDTGERQGIAYVKFSNREDKLEAFKMTGRILQGNRIEITNLSNEDFDNYQKSQLSFGRFLKIINVPKYIANENIVYELRMYDEPSEIVSTENSDGSTRTVFMQYESDDICRRVYGNKYRLQYDNRQPAVMEISNQHEFNMATAEPSLTAPGKKDNDDDYHEFDDNIMDMEKSKNQKKSNDIEKMESSNNTKLDDSNENPNISNELGVDNKKIDKLNPDPIVKNDTDPEPDPVVNNNVTDCVVVRGLPKDASSDKDVLTIFGTVNVVPTQIHIMFDNNCCPNGEAYCEFDNPTDMKIALSKNNYEYQTNIITVRPIPRDLMLKCIGRPLKPVTLPTDDDNEKTDFTEDLKSNFPRSNENRKTNFRRIDNNRRSSNENSSVLSKLHENPRNHPRASYNDYPGSGGGSYQNKAPSKGGPNADFGTPGCVVGLENVPYRADIEEILMFFEDAGFKVGHEDVIRRYDDLGRPTGDARVNLKNPKEAHRAVTNLNKRYIWERIINVFHLQKN